MRFVRFLPPRRLPGLVPLCDSCSSGRSRPFHFLRTPPRGGNPCGSGSRSRSSGPWSGLPPLRSHPASVSLSGPKRQAMALRAMPGAQKQRRPIGRLDVPRHGPATMPIESPYIRMLNVQPFCGCDSELVLASPSGIPCQASRRVAITGMRASMRAGSRSTWAAVISAIKNR